MSTIEARKALYDTKPTERRRSDLSLRTVFVDPTGTLLDTPQEGATERVGIEGYASTIETWYSVRDWLGEYDEMICEGAFAKTLQESADVRLLVNHEGLPLARTKSGTLNLREDPHGLHCDVPALDMESPLAQTVRSAMARGDIDQMSFAFRATRQDWNENYTKRWVREVQLFDVSVVTYPANDGTDVKLRSQGLSFDTVDRLVRGNPTAGDMEAVRALLAADGATAKADARAEGVRRRQAMLRAAGGV